MEYQYDSPGSQPYHQFMSMQPLSPPRSASDDYSPSSPDALKTLPNYPNYSGHPAYSYGQGQAYPMPHSQPSGPSSPHPHHSSFRHYNLSSLAMPYTPDGCTSEENDCLSPTQSRRKAQNRAAQQAFRKRKEQHVKDLETKLADMEVAQQRVSVENERLKKDILRASTENKILRATSSHADGRHHRNSSSSLDEQHQQPRFHQADFYANMPQDGSSRSLSHRVLKAKNGDRLLAAGATWDLIIGHRLVKKGLVNIGDVSERLVHHTYCDGHGPVYSERSIIAAIEQSIISKTDNLL
ncbi:hypothetical protein B0J13DRAFT_127389 [Dactylonectria estremocensis]|uniref:BZIP domain-containing protein n=1 Tax=Dactylonectria estremocensis TaxID=1079267 RepID=A0A9P9JBD6_9HYPO|nr:hypothetical protein B0J13DRAFT_127389 [Dactylonectria estremocensis]